jgi:hypothetical protein
MALPNSSIAINTGAGTNLAAETVSSKLYQAFMLAGPQGHILGTRDSYIALGFANSVVGANKNHYSFWNGTGLDIAVHGIWINNDFAVGVSGLVAVRIDLFRITSNFSTGTVFGTEATTATESVSRIDPGGAAVPAGLSIKKGPGGTGGVVGAFIGQAYFMPEEGITSIGYLTQWQNMVRYFGMDDVKDLVIPDGQGFKITQGPVASVGQVGVRIVFTTY